MESNQLGLSYLYIRPATENASYLFLHLTLNDGIFWVDVLDVVSKIIPLRICCY